MVRRKVLQAVTLLLAALLLVPCLGQAGEKVTLTITPVKGNPIFNANMEEIAAFEKANPNIKVEIADIPYSVLLEKMMASLMAKSPEYDVLFVNDDWMPLFARGPSLVPLDTVPEMKEDLADLIDFMRDEINTFPHPKYRLPAKKRAEYGEPHVWSMPFMFGTVVLFYRTDLVPKPPTTRDEFIAAAKAATKAPDQWGFATMLKAPEFGIAYIVFPTILEEGGDLFDEKWRPTINTPAVRSMLQFVYDMIWTYKIAPPGMPAYGRTESIGLFMDGKAAMTQEESYRWGALKDPTKSKVADKVGVAVQPNWASTTKYGREITGGSWGWGVNAYSRHKPEAIKLVKWLSSREANIRLWQKTGTGVPRKSAEAELLRTDPNYKVIAESIKYYGGYIWSKKRMVNIPEWPELAQKIQAHFVTYWTKQKSMDEVVVAAEKEAYEILRKAGYYD